MRPVNAQSLGLIYTSPLTLLAHRLAGRGAREEKSGSKGLAGRLSATCVCDFMAAIRNVLSRRSATNPPLGDWSFPPTSERCHEVTMLVFSVCLWCWWRVRCPFNYHAAQERDRQGNVDVNHLEFFKKRVCRGADVSFRLTCCQITVNPLGKLHWLPVDL